MTRGRPVTRVLPRLRPRRFVEQDVTVAGRPGVIETKRNTATGPRYLVRLTNGVYLLDVADDVFDTPVT